MKLCVSNPNTSQHIVVEVEDDKKVLPFFDRRMGQVIPADSLGPEWKGYMLKISGGNDKQGFPMLQGVAAKHRVRLLMKDGMKCYRARRKGTLKRKSVRGCIVSGDISKLDLVVHEEGDAVIAGLNDDPLPARLLPKRANKIRKMFDIEKDFDLKQLTDVLTRTKLRAREENKERKVVPKIHRLMTEQKLKRKAVRMKAIRDRKLASRAKKAAYLASKKN